MQYDCHDEPLFSLTDADLAILNADKTMIGFALTTVVPDEKYGFDSLRVHQVHHPIGR